MSRSLFKTYSIAEVIEQSQSIDCQQNEIVQGLLPVGLTFLAAGPKAGKSVIASQLAASIVLGNPFLGKFPAEKGSCLYLALEESPQDMSERMRRYSDADFGERLKVAFEWEQASKGGNHLLRAWLEDHIDRKAVFIDTYVMYKCSESGKGFSYATDYKELAPLKEMAINYNVAVVLLHHTVKMSYKDWLSNLYGSTGIGAASDTSWFLDRYRGAEEATLKVTSRKVADQQHELQMDRENRRWKYLSTANSITQSPERQAILFALGRVKGPMKLHRIAKEVKKSEANTHKLLSNLMKSGLVVKNGTGVYCLSAKGEKSYQLMLE